VVTRRPGSWLPLLLAVALGCFGRNSGNVSCSYLEPESTVTAFIEAAKASDSSVVEAVSLVDPPVAVEEWRIIDISYSAPDLVYSLDIAVDSVTRLEKRRRRLELRSLALKDSMAYYEAEYQKRREHVLKLMERNRDAMSAEERDMVGRILRFIDEAEREREAAAERCIGLKEDYVKLRNKLGYMRRESMEYREVLRRMKAISGDIEKCEADVARYVREVSRRTDRKIEAAKKDSRETIVGRLYKSMESLLGNYRRRIRIHRDRLAGKKKKLSGEISRCEKLLSEAKKLERTIELSVACTGVGPGERLTIRRARARVRIMPRAEGREKVLVFRLTRAVIDGASSNWIITGIEDAGNG